MSQELLDKIEHLEKQVAEWKKNHALIESTLLIERERLGEEIDKFFNKFSEERKLKDLAQEELSLTKMRLESNMTLVSNLKRDLQNAVAREASMKSSLGRLKREIAKTAVAPKLNVKRQPFIESCFD